MTRHSASNSATLRVRISEDLVGESVLKALLKKNFFHERLNWEITPAGEAPLPEAFEKGDVDIFLGDPSSDLSRANIRPTRTATVNLIWAAAPSFDLQKRPLPFALYPPGCAWRQPIIETLDKDLVEWMIAMESGSLAALQSAARSAVAVIACLQPALSSGLVALSPESFALPKPPSVQVAMYRGRQWGATPFSQQAEDFLWKLTVGSS
jgi:DNA-binding transcriptional LysR family regulator